MKKLNYKFIAIGSLAVFTTVYSCKRALDTNPAGVLAGSTLASKAGVDGLLIGAYSLLDGYYQGQPGTNYGSGIANWSYGGIASDDAYKGSSADDQSADASPIENHTVDANNGYLYSKWQVNLAGVVRANNVIQEVPLVTDGSLTAAQGQQAIAEARFLRGVYNFELMKVFRNVPYVDETITYAAGNLNVPNPGPIWDKIEADFAAAMVALPTTQPQAGRANKYAAEAFLAKAYMYDHQYAKALPLLNDLITNGTTASGAKYALVPYSDNFNATTRNNAESVFAAQMTVKDGSNGQNSDFGDVLNFPAGGTFTGCCGFYLPSYNLANAFKTDDNGLPLFQKDPATGFPQFNVTNLKNDHGIAATAAFAPTTEPVDPRLDWTVGRRGIPYLDWALCGGEGWARGLPSDFVPYVPKKNVFYQKDMATTAEQGGGWATNQGSGINYNLIRFADIILWRAECEVEANTLAAAEADVNLIRNRMAQHPEYWVHTYVDNSAPTKGNTNTAAANYVIKPYTGQFTANNQAYARAAVYMEHELEFGMEGHRFFDLQRWDARFGGPAGASFMANTLNAYIKADTRISNPVLNGKAFTAGKHEIFPIPQIEISKEAGALKQNTGY